MANPTQTFRKLLHSLHEDDHVTVGGVKWRAGEFLRFLVGNNDPRLSENAVEMANGSITLYAAGMGAVDATTPAVVAVTHKNNTGGR